MRLSGDLDRKNHLELKITGVKAVTVAGNYYWTFAKVYSGEKFGVGEGYVAPQLENVILELSPLIVGENALDLNKILDKLRWATIPAGSAGITYHAISAIEIAILDLIGKCLNVPVYTLLGGKLRDKVRIYVDTHAGKSLHARDRALRPTTTKWMRESGATKEDNVESRDPMFGRSASFQEYSDEFSTKSYASRAREMKDEGYTAVKFDLDVPTPYSTASSQRSGFLNNKEIEYLSGLVASVRESVGDQTDIMFDLHWKFDFDSSIRLLNSVEPCGVMWMEDPVPPEDPSVLSRIRKATRVPIASGENVYNRYGLSRLIETGIPIITPDALKAGGLYEMRLVSQLAAMKEAVVSPHNVASPLGTIAQAHLCASITNFGVLEFHGRDVPIWNKLSKRGNVINKGFIELKDDPGLGIELDESIAKKYSLDEDHFDF